MIKKLLRPIYWSLYKIAFNWKHYKPIFILGCGHSGTTLILRILAEHKDLHVLDYESDMFNEKVTRYPLIRQLEKERKKLSKQYWVEKTPRHIKYIDQIFKLMPQAKIIMMLRDGRDVAVSMKKRFGNIKTGVNRWVNENEKGLKYINDKRVLLIKLEEFVAKPEFYVKKITDHLHINFYKEIMEYHKKTFKYQKQDAIKTDGVGDNHQKNRNWQVNQPVFKDTSRWKKEMTNEEIDYIKSNIIFMRLLKKFNYE